MNRRRFAIFLLFLGFSGPARVAVADEAAKAWNALRAGGHVALMRHADAPGGVGDPPGFRVEDCATQRNLSPKGRTDAETIGSRLKQEGIAFDTILSSPWCRCVDTATLVDAGAVQIEPNFANAFVLSEQRAALREGGRALLARWRGPGVLLVVTHGENIAALTGASPAPAEIVVVAAADDAALRVIGSIPAR